MKLLAAAALLLTGCGRPHAGAAPPSDPDPYPLSPGARWTYRSQLGLKVVREVRATAGGLEMVYTLPVLGEQRLPMRRGPEGVVARRGDREQLVLRFPMRAGDRWRIEFSDQDLADCVVEGEEVLRVLGQERSCTRLSVRRSSSNDTEWYAPGIGLVRMRVTMLGLTQTFDLESYAP